MFTIGDFARFGRVSVRMLRHYDEIGLLPPATVDASTGYRFYTADQLARLNRIAALKDLGFTLHQVAQIVDDRLSAERLRGMLQLRKAQLAQQVAADTARLAAVEARLRRIEKEGDMPAQDVVITTVPATLVAELVGVAAGYGDHAIGPVIQPLYKRLDALVPASGLTIVGPSIAYYEDTEEGVVVHAAEQVAGTPVTGTPLTLVRLPEVPRAATTVHRGRLADIDPAFDALARWIDENGYTALDPVREVYLHCPPDIDSSEWVVELQVPISTPQG
ncbi:MerR family transcriptional regulator [Nocardia sp. NPDC050406]|uniref:MerR family transcriptional regulator n=1 Tax=Nocardia sp. NPDC050406 TaxID=3364318 RepID=UPI0037985767